MDPLSCPVCDAEMDARPLGDGEVNSCPAGHGVFLRRADLGSLVESESDWHRHAGPAHAADAADHRRHDRAAAHEQAAGAGAWVETLFGSSERGQMSRNGSMLAPSSLRRSARSS